MTLELAWIDIGKSENVAGITYAAISRVRNLSTCVIEPMTFERLRSIKKCKSLQFRINEERRLDEIASYTAQNCHLVIPVCYLGPSTALFEDTNKHA